MRRPARHRGQALVEFSLTLPIFALFVFATVQLSLLFIWFYSETRMARETARWLAVYGSSSDVAFANHVQASMLPGLVGGTPTLVTAGSLTQDAAYSVGRMTVTFSPCVPSGGVCTHPNRAPGSTLHVQMSYDATNIIFLPTNFRLGWMSVSLPTSLPPYTVYVMAE